MRGVGSSVSAMNNYVRSCIACGWVDVVGMLHHTAVGRKIESIIIFDQRHQQQLLECFCDEGLAWR